MGSFFSVIIAVIIIVGIEEFHSDSNPISDIYPNPASEMTVIELNLEQGSQASIDILDVSGRLVQEIHKGAVQPGQSNYFLDARTLQSGVYIVRLVVGEQMFSRRLMVD